MQGLVNKEEGRILCLLVSLLVEWLMRLGMMETEINCENLQ